MKTGVIVYVVGTEGLDDTIDFEEAGKRLEAGFAIKAYPPAIHMFRLN